MSNCPPDLVEDSEGNCAKKCPIATYKSDTNRCLNCYKNC